MVEDDFVKAGEDIMDGPLQILLEILLEIYDVYALSDPRGRH